MTQELRERVARAIYDAGQTWLRDNPFNFPTAMPPQVLADAAIALVLEEAAKECMADLPGEGGPMEDGYRLACEENARNIRAMKGMRDE